jgi:hypothetical protein
MDIENIVGLGLNASSIPNPEETKSAAGRLGKYEVESAVNLLRDFFREKGRWCAFFLTDFMAFAKRRGEDENAALVGLMGYWINGPESPTPICSVHETDPFIVIDENGVCHITSFFIDAIMV